MIPIQGEATRETYFACRLGPTGEVEVGTCHVGRDGSCKDWRPVEVGGRHGTIELTPQIGTGLDRAYLKAEVVKEETFTEEGEYERRIVTIQHLEVQVAIGAIQYRSQWSRIEPTLKAEQEERERDKQERSLFGWIYQNTPAEVAGRVAESLQHREWGQLLSPYEIKNNTVLDQVLGQQIGCDPLKIPYRMDWVGYRRQLRKALLQQRAEILSRKKQAWLINT